MRNFYFLVLFGPNYNNIFFDLKLNNILIWGKFTHKTELRFYCVGTPPPAPPAYFFCFYFSPQLLKIFFKEEKQVGLKS